LVSYRGKNLLLCSSYLPLGVPNWPVILHHHHTVPHHGSKRVQGAGAGVVLISPQGDKLKYVLRMSFPQASNNEAEYEALLHGMKMAKAFRATRLKIFGDSNLVVQQVMN
jgi:hypothetical protein